MADTVIVNASTGRQETRPLTAEEQAQRDSDAAAAAQQDSVRQGEASTESTLRDRLVAGYDAMKTHVDRGTFTAAQRDAALLLCLRGVMALIRLTLRRLDATD